MNLRAKEMQLLYEMGFYKEMARMKELQGHHDVAAWLREKADCYRAALVELRRPRRR